jgi:hypothetical protein
MFQNKFTNRNIGREIRGRRIFEGTSKAYRRITEGNWRAWFVKKFVKHGAIQGNDESESEFSEF